MRSGPDPFRLSFLLPDGALLERALSRYAPVAAGAELTVDAAGLIVFSGSTREAVFANCGEFVRVLWPFARGVAIAAMMVTERDPACGMPSGRDSWSIIAGKQVAFCPTGMPAHFPPLPPRPPPARVLLPGDER